MSRSRIVCAGPLPEPGPDLLGSLGDLVEAPDGEPATLLPLLADADVLIARGPTRVPAELIAAAPRLRAIGRNGIGVDGIDLAAATRCGVAVVVVPDGAVDAVSEGTLALLLALAKRLGELDALVREGDWDGRDRIALGDLAGATLAVVGAGRIGRRVAQLGVAFGMDVLAVDPALDPAGAGLPAGVRAAPLRAAVAAADYLTLHVPLTAATRGLIDRTLLATARPGLRLVNVSRGAVAPLDELEGALAAGILAGVGLDVFDPEPPDPGHPIFRRAEVLCSPHALALTPAARRRTFQLLAGGLAEVLSGRRAPAVANPDVYA
ncbi:oxidoreductase [Baekduia soli]|uniref:Oxidoreductase n=1 Tax=Baekduia soli TaxID=496014 RepID=A0A5B8UB48_9ACTN|nr:NAD(P)-dependent oxidoreductase [Baekduia soli]QEC50439.1 oxidoreductase [Baekduia soli]